MKKSPRVASIGIECVACGCCMAVCPRSAIRIAKGVRAKVDQEQCVGCGLCTKECPAAVITIKERGDAS